LAGVSGTVTGWRGKAKKHETNVEAIIEILKHQKKSIVKY